VDPTTPLCSPPKPQLHSLIAGAKMDSQWPDPAPRAPPIPPALEGSPPHGPRSQAHPGAGWRWP
jgi:hypothetical protein